jgi:DNA-binding transcriptional ArsR family regulator
MHRTFANILCIILRLEITSAPMADPPEPTTHLNAAQMRILAHPIRSRLLGLLRVEGPSTSSRLAARLATNSGSTSYHLRRLADVGLVTEDQQLGTERERWWRAVHTMHSWKESEHDADPDTRAAADWLLRHAHRRYAHHVEGWHDVRTDWPVEWRDAADQSDYLIRVTAPQLAELNRRVADLVEQYSHASDEQAGEQVTILYYSFPRRDVPL